MRFAETYADKARELEQCLKAETSRPVRMWKLTEAASIPEGADVCLVQFSREDNYVEQEYRFVRVRRDIRGRFLKRMAEL